MFPGFSYGWWDDAKIKRWLKEYPTPKNPTLTRVVTNHGDFHLYNLIKTPEGKL